MSTLQTTRQYLEELNNHEKKYKELKGIEFILRNMESKHPFLLRVLDVLKNPSPKEEKESKGEELLEAPPGTIIPPSVPEAIPILPLVPLQDTRIQMLPPLAPPTRLPPGITLKKVSPQKKKSKKKRKIEEVLKKLPDQRNPFIKPSQEQLKISGNLPQEMTRTQ